MPPRRRPRVASSTNANEGEEVRGLADSIGAMLSGVLDRVQPPRSVKKRDVADAGAVEFKGVKGPLDAYSWVDKMEMAFESTELPEEKKVKMTVSFLDDSAHHWWTLTRRNNDCAQTMTWEQLRHSSWRIVMQLDLYAELKGHNDHVSSMEFNSSGDLLVSGSYDNQVIFWNWETKTRRLSYDPGHLKNVRQAKIMPLTNDRRIVTACGDGEVLEDGQVHTKRLVSHRGAVHKLAVEPGNPNIIYSCGDYSFVQHFDLRSNSATKLFSCTRLIRGEPLPGTLDLYQMVFDPSNPKPNYFCLRGNDAYARVYDIRKCWQDRSSSLVKPVNTFRPAHLIYPHHFMIIGLAYSNSGELLVSYSDELIYLFQKHMGLCPPLFQPEDMEEVDKPAQLVGHRNGNTCKVNFFRPNNEYVLSGSYCGHIFIWKKNGGELVRFMTGDSLDVYDIQPDPHNPVIATCGSENNLKLWAPVANDDASPLPDDIAEIMESNRQARIDSYMPYFASENHYQRMRGQSNGDATSEER